MALNTPINITETVAPAGAQPIAFGQGGLEIEYFRVPFTGGVALAEEVVITPRWISDVRIVQSNFSATDNLSLTAVNSAVTLTLRASTATNVNGSFMVSIVGRR